MDNTVKTVVGICHALHAMKCGSTYFNINSAMVRMLICTSFKLLEYIIHNYINNTVHVPMHGQVYIILCMLY